MSLNTILKKLLDIVNKSDVSKTSIINEVDSYVDELLLERQRRQVQVAYIKKYINEEAKEYNKLCLAKERNDQYKKSIKIDLVYLKIISIMISIITIFFVSSISIPISIMSGIISCLAVYNTCKIIEFHGYNKFKKYWEVNDNIRLDDDDVDTYLEESRDKINSLNQDLILKENEIGKIEKALSLSKYIKNELFKNEYKVSKIKNKILENMDNSTSYYKVKKKVNKQ